VFIVAAYKEIIGVFRPCLLGQFEVTAVSCRAFEKYSNSENLSCRT
jgi:hypothetical protein